MGHQSIVDILLEKGVSTQTPNDLGYLPQDVNPQIQLKKLVRPNYSTPNQFKLLKQKALLVDDMPTMSSLERKASEQQYFRKGRVKETQMKVLSEEEQIVAEQKKRQLEVAQLAKKSAVKNNPLYQKLEKVSTIKRRPVNQVPCTTTTSNNSSCSFDSDALENNTPKIDTTTLITKTTNDDTTTTTTTTRIVHDDAPDDTLDNIINDDIHGDTTNDMHNYAKDIDNDIDVFDNYVNDIDNDVNNSDDANGIHYNTNDIDNDADDTNSDINSIDNDTNAIDNNTNVIDNETNNINNDTNDVDNDAKIINSDKDDIHNSKNDTGIIIIKETQKKSNDENTKDFDKEDSLVSTSDDDDDDEDEGVQYKALTAARILTAPIYKKSDEIKTISPIDTKFSTSTTLTSNYLISDEAIPRETKRRSGSQKAAWSMSMSSWAAILDREFNLNELDAERKARQDSLKTKSEKVESEEVESEEAPYEKIESEEVENEKVESEEIENEKPKFDNFKFEYKEFKFDNLKFDNLKLEKLENFEKLEHEKYEREEEKEEVPSPKLEPAKPIRVATQPRSSSIVRRMSIPSAFTGYGKLYLHVNSVQDILLPLPKDRTYVRCVVSDGRFEYMSRYEVLSQNIEFDYECVIDTHPDMIITLSLHVRPDYIMKTRKSFSRLFSSRKKKKESLSGYVNKEDGAIGQARFALAHMAPACTRARYQAGFSCFNAWYARSFKERHRQKKKDQDVLKVVGNFEVDLLFLSQSPQQVKTKKKKLKWSRY